MNFRQNKHIEIVSSGNPALSSMSKKSRDAVQAVLRRHYRHVGITLIENLSDLQSLVAKKPDLVFLGMKRIPGTDTSADTWVSAYLEASGITCTGSPAPASRLEFDKILAKQRVFEGGIQTAPFYLVRRGDSLPKTASTTRYPVFIKPTNRGGGEGIDTSSVAYTEQEVHTKVASLAAEFGADSLVEEYLDGREFSVALLRSATGDTFQVMPIEIYPPDTDGHAILTSAVKSSSVETATGPVTDTKLAESLSELALDAFRALGARDYGRIDIRLDRTGVPHFLEANLIPCIIDGSGNFSKAYAMHVKKDYESMVLAIVELAFARSVPIVDENAELQAIIVTGIQPAIS